MKIYPTYFVALTLQHIGIPYCMSTFLLDPGKE